MDLIGAVEALLIFSSIIILPLIYIRVRGNKESSQYQERPSQDWEDTVSYHEGVEYLKVMRHDKEPENDEQKKE
jgi:hypothetical protein